MSESLTLIIVEDDPLIAFDLKEVVESGGYTVKAVCHSWNDLAKIDFSNVDLALLDVNLNAEKDGIDIGVHLSQTHRIPCIFITSYYDEPTIDRAKEANPLAYILKPYEEQDILTNLNLSKARIHALINAETAPSPKLLFVKKGNKLIKIDALKVTYAQAFDVYTHLFVDGKRITASQSLKEIEKLFTPHNFMRVHRSFIVNLNCIDGICENEILLDNTKIPVGRTYKKALFERIKTI